MSEGREHTSREAFSGEDYYSAYWASTIHGVGHVSEAGVFLDCNDAYLKILGRTRAQVIGHAFQEFTYMPDLGTDIQNVAELVEGYANSYGMDKSYVMPDGTLRHVNLQVRRIPWSLNHPFRHFVVHCYRKEPLPENVKVEKVDGRVRMRTTTSLWDLVADNKKAIPWLIIVILLLGFVSGNLTEVLEFFRTAGGEP